MKMWICRNTMSLLKLFMRKPHSFKVDEGEWDWSDYDCPIAIIDEDLFSEVTFENSPMEVELKLIEKCKELL